ncbi:hypothetical protein GCM10007895_21560 [Paraferrimonas sedimenticola]|uniref:Tetratricopeptide repeat protein n=1 Tax=Paraferrimonas sedimenticola TaxID=375674 RepID=A0AA37W104_9GAMM|nr:hypothetical protein GCM10007895_21560 [Paraferrimonas sedimenticola]
MTPQFLFWGALVICLFCSRAYAVECDGSASEAAISACQQQLAAEPRNTDLRIKLADALILSEQYDSAVATLSQGITISPSNQDLKDKLAQAKSIQEEQRYIEQKRQQTEAASSQPDSEAKLRMHTLRCTSLTPARALTACNDGLAIAPNNLELIVGKADALFDLGQVTNALLGYRQAASIAPSDQSIQTKLALANSARQTVVDRCLAEDEQGALAACEQALIVGHPDEIQILVRQGELLQTSGETEQALAAYLQAQQRDPNDETINAAVASLTEPVETEAKITAAAPAQSPQPQPEEPQLSESPVDTVAATIEPQQQDEVVPQPVAQEQAPPRKFDNGPLRNGVTF